MLMFALCVEVAVKFSYFFFLLPFYFTATLAFPFHQSEGSHSNLYDQYDL